MSAGRSAAPHVGARALIDLRTTLLTSREIVLQTDAIAPLPMLIGVRDDLLDMLPLHLDTVPRAIGITLPADRSMSREGRLLVDALTETARLLAAELRKHHAGSSQSQPG